MKKHLKKIKTDKEAEELLKKDLSGYLHKDNFIRVTFEFAPKSKSISLRLSEELLNAVKKASRKRGISYQKFIREAVELSIRKEAA